MKKKSACALMWGNILGAGPVRARQHSPKHMGLKKKGAIENMLGNIARTRRNILGTQWEHNGNLMRTY